MRTSMKTRNVANSIICLGLLTPWTNRSCQQSKILVNLFAYLLVDEVTKFLFANPIVTFAESLRYFVCVLSLSDVPLGYYRASSNCRPAFCFFQIPWLTSSCSFSRGVANGVPQRIFMERGSLSGIWWLFVFGVRCLWRPNLTSYSGFQAKFVNIIGIFFYTHFLIFVKNQALYTPLVIQFL